MSFTTSYTCSKNETSSAPLGSSFLREEDDFLGGMNANILLIDIDYDR
jgi:hypothetical protein